MEAVLHKGYLGRLIPDIRNSLREWIYNDNDGCVFTHDRTRAIINIQRGRFIVQLHVDPTILERKDVIQFSKDIWTKDYTNLCLSNKMLLMYEGGELYIAHATSLRPISISSLPLCKQLIDALLAVAS